MFLFIGIFSLIFAFLSFGATILAMGVGSDNCENLAYYIFICLPSFFITVWLIFIAIWAFIQI